MAHRKWKETKLQPGTAGLGNRLGCCLVSFHFLWAILCPQAVHVVVCVLLSVPASLHAWAHHAAFSRPTGCCLVKNHTLMFCTKCLLFLCTAKGKQHPCHWPNIHIQRKEIDNFGHLRLPGLSRYRPETSGLILTRF